MTQIHDLKKTIDSLYNGLTLTSSDGQRANKLSRIDLAENRHLDIPAHYYTSTFLDNTHKKNKEI